MIYKENQVITDGAMTAEIISSVINVGNVDRVGVILEWTGTSPVGTLTVEAQNEGSSWIALDMGTINVTGNSGNHILNLSDLPFQRLQVKYNFVSGTGTLNAYQCSKIEGVPVSSPALSGVTSG